MGSGSSIALLMQYRVADAKARASTNHTLYLDMYWWLCLSGNFRLVKLVSGNAGSKRITIPKDIVEKLGLKDADYVAVTYEGNRKASIAPAKVTVET